MSQPQAEEEGLTRVATSVMPAAPSEQVKCRTRAVFVRSARVGSRKKRLAARRSRSLRASALHRTKLLVAEFPYKVELYRPPSTIVQDAASGFCPRGITHV